MENFMTSEREEYINKLDSQIQAIDSILKMNLGTVVSAEMQKRLRELKTEAQIVLKKVKNDEFEISIVGLEKAGKSTFANALMENNLLPTKDLRCTFTSTQIEYSGDDQDDSATVSFYSIEEFDKDFKDKLSTLDFPGSERYSFDTISEQTYLDIYEREVSPQSKKLYGDSIHEDILAIIRNVSSLSMLLGRPDISFASDRIRSGELASYITDESKARAVKQVIIRSKELSGMKNAIIFDVPGFNSPTELHKIQTRERMKSADAIIVVANGMYPSLTEESLKILRESDDEGNPLSDKLFVFANKIEGAKDIPQNISDTYNEWLNKRFVSASNKHRIIFGSALAHLQASGLDTDNRTLRAFKERENQIPDGDGIEAMRQLLAKYNHNERFEVLKRRINRIKADIFKVFNEIRSLNEDSTLNRSYSSEQIALIAELIDDIRPITKKNLLDLKAEIRSYMPSEQPLSKRIVEYINQNITTEKYSISDELIDIAIKRSPFTGLHEDTGRIEGYVREVKFKEMYGDFSQNVINIADEHHVKYSAQIIAVMLNAMGVVESSPYYDDLKELLEQEISAYRSDLKSSDNSNELYYQSLIERFSREIYQVLITSQYSTERLREFYDSIDNFYSLSIFYKKGNAADDLSYINVAPKDQPLCMMLLFHHYVNAIDTMRMLSDELCRVTGLRELPTEVWEFAQKAFSAVGGRKEIVLEAVSKAFTKDTSRSKNDSISSIYSSDMFKGILGTTSSVMSASADILEKTEDFRINLLRKTLAQVVESNEPCSVADREGFTRYYERYHSTLRGGKLYSVDDFRKDFDVDIQILQDVLANAFVRAISMEKPFVARETKSIDDIIDYVESKGFSKFLSENFWKIKYEETQLLDKQRREQEQNAAIVGAINSYLSTISD